jgi:DNA topoisomerase I
VRFPALLLHEALDLGVQMKLTEPITTACHADLCYTCDSSPGIARRRRGSGFAYLLPNGRPLRNKAQLARIRALAIPPAWERVWICPRPDGHLQATGIDARGRKQYRYHALWSERRNLVKFEQMWDFGHALGAMRRRIRRDMEARGMVRERVLACIVHLMDEAMIRVGNDEYARDNNSFGLTTIRNGHANVRGDEVHFNFRAKGGKACAIRLESPHAARIVRRCQDLPGQELFGYINGDGVVRDVGSADVNTYLMEISGRSITAKDFRTWAGTVIAAESLLKCGEPVDPRRGGPLSARELRKREVAAVRAAAAGLCNTPATCRKYYVHPQLIDWYARGTLHRALNAATRSRRPAGLSQVERAVLELLRPAKGGRKVKRAA